MQRYEPKTPTETKVKIRLVKHPIDGYRSFFTVVEGCALMKDFKALHELLEALNEWWSREAYGSN